MLTLFLRHIRRVDEPVIAPRLVHGPGFASVNVINVFYTGAGMGLVVLLSWYATTRYDIDTFGSGTVLAAVSVATATMASVSDEALGLARVFIVYAVLTVAVGIPAVRQIPEHRGSW